MKRFAIEIKWSLIFAVMTLVWALLGKALNFDDTAIQYNQVFNTLILIPAFVIYLLEGFDKRRQYYHGIISYKQALASGLMLSVFVAFLGILTTWISVSVITPDLFANSIRHVTSTGLMSAADAQQQFSLSTFLITGFFAAPVTGLVLSLITSAIVKTKKSRSLSPEVR
jgi:hypothetical protein